MSSVKYTYHIVSLCQLKVLIVLPVTATLLAPHALAVSKFTKPIGPVRMEINLFCKRH